MTKEVKQQEGEGAQNPLDFSHKHPVFELHLVKEKSEFSELHAKQVEFAATQNGKFAVPQIEIPKNWPGLTLRTGELPSTRMWWQPSSSFQRNGYLNISTPRLHRRMGPILFFTLVLYGWVGNQMNGYHYQRYNNNDQPSDYFYDKMHPRIINFSKLWLRPG